MYVYKLSPELFILVTVIVVLVVVTVIGDQSIGQQWKHFDE